MTRVAVVTPYYAPEVGGVQHYAQRMVTALRETPGFTAVVLTTARGRRTEVDEVDGTTVVRLGTWLRLSNTPLSPLWPLQVRRWLDRLDVDVVSAHSPVPGLADVTAYAAGGRPVVLTFHSGSLLKGSGGMVDRLLDVYQRRVLPRVFDRCAGLAAVSPVALTHATGRAALVPPGVDTRTFTPPASGVRERSLLYVGRVERSSSWKGVDVLLDAMPALLERRPDTVLRIVGDGDAVPTMQARARDLGVDHAVRWEGLLRPAEVVDHYRRAAVTVLPSLSEAESFGMALVEAMASGCPVVGSDVGGIPYVVRDGVDGLLVPPGDAARLAGACLRVLDDPALAASLGAAGRVAAEERWDWARSTELMVEQLAGQLPAKALAAAAYAGLAVPSERRRP